MTDDGAIPEDEQAEYESGPFCRHWGDPSDCEEMCECGHECNEHPCDCGCQVDSCDCKEWRERETAVDD